MSGNQLWLVQPNGCYCPGGTVYLETGHRCDGVVDLFVGKKATFIILLLQSRLLGLWLVLEQG